MNFAEIRVLSAEPLNLKLDVELQGLLQKMALS